MGQHATLGQILDQQQEPLASHDFSLALHYHDDA